MSIEGFGTCIRLREGKCSSHQNNTSAMPISAASASVASKSFCQSFIIPEIKTRHGGNEVAAPGGHMTETVGHEIGSLPHLAFFAFREG